VRERPKEVRRTLQYIFQSPYNSLNPRRTVGEILTVPLALFFDVRERAARARTERLLAQVGLPASMIARYPDELSGGERQRVAIARALACEPDVLICDEITSALDVSVQAAIVQLLEELQREAELAILFVTHNLALVRTIAHRVVVLDRGSIVETGAPDELLLKPGHPYTQQLVADTPTLGSLWSPPPDPASTPRLRAS
jgi:peptide/nickel transport system ATP-binding protein